MKKMKLLLGLSMLVLSTVLLSCNVESTLTEEDQNTTVNLLSNRSTRTSNLWEPMDSFRAWIWNKADWTNGDMFNVGWKPTHAYHSNGKLVLKLDNTKSHGKPYTSGEYRSNQTFGYGKFETNMKAAKGSGLVTSFFLYTGSPSWHEIDFEILGKDTTKVQLNYYVDGIGGNEKIIDLGFDASTRYAKYTIEYGNGYINWYVNGNWVYGVNNAGFNAPKGKKMPSHPMQIMVNLWPGIGVDGWLGKFNYSGPKYAYYDYIKYTK